MRRTRRPPSAPLSRSLAAPRWTERWQPTPEPQTGRSRLREARARDSPRSCSRNLDLHILSRLGRIRHEPGGIAAGIATETGPEERRLARVERGRHLRSARRFGKETGFLHLVHALPERDDYAVDVRVRVSFRQEAGKPGPDVDSLVPDKAHEQSLHPLLLDWE